MNTEKTELRGQCIDCGDPRIKGSARCEPCRTGHYLWKTYFTGNMQSRNIVAKAKKRGEIPSIAGRLCDDCGKPANVYDHRDYGKPLDVDPVCFSCNCKRGYAKPIDQRIVIGLFTRFIEENLIWPDLAHLAPTESAAA